MGRAGANYLRVRITKKPCRKIIKKIKTLRVFYNKNPEKVNLVVNMVAVSKWGKKLPFL